MDNIDSLQISSDVTNIIEIKTKTEALRTLLIQIQSNFNKVNKAITELDKRIKALENGSKA